MNPPLMVLNFHEVAAKALMQFYKNILMIWNFQAAAAKPFTQDSIETLMFFIFVKLYLEAGLIKGLLTCEIRWRFFGGTIANNSI